MKVEMLFSTSMRPEINDSVIPLQEALAHIFKKNAKNTMHQDFALNPQISNMQKQQYY